MQPPPATSTRRDPVRIVVGLALLIPALIALVISYIRPTVWTIWKSFHQFIPFDGGADEFVGTDNYQAVADQVAGPTGFALLTVLLPLLMLVLVAPLLAWLATRWGRAGRIVTRLALTLPMVCFVPVALATGWRFDRFDLDSPRFEFLLAGWLSGFGLACALGVTFYLAALRRPAPATVWPAVLTVGGLATIAILAIGLQAYTYPALVTGGGPEGQTTTPMLDMFISGLRQFQFGPAAATATILLVPLMLLGFAAALLVILTGLRIELAPASEPRRAGGVRTGAVIGTCAGLVAVLAVTGYGLRPWLSRLGSLGDGWESVVGDLLVNSWLAPLVSTVVGVGLAAVAGFGIGWLRPLGRASELLLLPFAPWLFIGIGPLFIAKYGFADSAERIDTFAGLIPPVWVVVPALFLFTVLFRGLERRQRELVAGGTRPGAAAARTLPAALPMLVLVGAATWLVQAQSLLWPQLAGFSRTTITNWVSQHATTTIGADTGFGLVLPIPAIALLAVVLAVLHVLYLDRLTIRVGHGPD